MGISRKTFYDWRKRNKGFAKAWEEAWEAGTQALEEEARRRAVEGTEEAVWRGGKQVGVTRRYSDLLLLFLLKGRRPLVYAKFEQPRDNSPLEIVLKYEDRGLTGKPQEEVQRTRVLPTGNGPIRALLPPPDPFPTDGEVH